MSDEKRGSPPLSENNGLEKLPDKGGGTDNDLADTTIIDANSTLDVNSTLEISYDLISHFKFTKSVTTDDIVNVNADSIEYDSFKYVTKESLIKALIYFIKSVDHVTNKDLSSVPHDTNKADTSCQYDVYVENMLPDAETVPPTSNSLALTPHKQVDFSNSSQLAHKDCFVTPDKVDRIDKRVDELSKSMLEIKSMLDKIIPLEIAEKIPALNISEANQECTPIAIPTYAEVSQPVVNTAIQVEKEFSQVTENQQNSKNNEILLLVPNDNKSKAGDKMNHVKKAVEAKLKDTQVEFIKTNPKSMKVIIGFKNKAVRDQIKDEIDSSCCLDIFQYHTKSGSKMLPKIYLHNVLEEILDNVDRSVDTSTIRENEKKVIVSKILAKNPCIVDLHDAGHTIDVVYINKNMNTKLLSIGLKVSPAIRLAIIDTQGGNLYLGNSRYQFKDRYHVKHCYHCQMIGHISTDCPHKNGDAVCMYCMGKHRSSSCNFKENEAKYCCARCLASSQANDAENYKSHNASNAKCPVTLREIERLKENTELLSKNVM